MRKTALAALIAAAFVFGGCRDDPAPTSPELTNEGSVFSQGTAIRPIHWTTHEVHFCDGGQVQTVYPLDEDGDLFLVGRICPQDPDDYRVYDLSSGEAVLVASVATAGYGLVTAAHSVPGREIGFGGRNNIFVVYDGGFQTIPMPCSPGVCFITDVWAASPTDVWIVTGPSFPGFPPLGIIWYWDGESFTVEHEGGAYWSLWGFGGPHPTAIYAVGDRIMKRDQDGTWHEMMGRDEVLGTCGPWGLFDVHGQDPADVRTVGYEPCLFHYDPHGWSEMPLPDNGIAFGGLWSLSATQILLAGMGGEDPEAGSIALWGSSDGGYTWEQFSDPAFVGLPKSDMRFFDLAATRGGHRIFGPSLGGTLALGEVGSRQADMVETMRRNLELMQSMPY